MKQKIIMAVCAVLLFTLGFQVANIMNRREKTAEPEQPAAAAPAFDEEAATSAECEGLPVVADTTVLRDYKGRAVSADSLRGEDKLVARFSANACRPCVDAMTASLMRYAAARPEVHIYMLLSGMPLRDLYVLAPQLGPQFTLLDCNGLPVDFNNGETPVLFRVDSTGLVRDHFTARYGDYARTDRYLDAL